MESWDTVPLNSNGSKMQRIARKVLSRIKSCKLNIARLLLYRMKLIGVQCTGKKNLSLGYDCTVCTYMYTGYRISGSTCYLRSTCSALEITGAGTGSGTGFSAWALN